jgi:dipeptidyl aminopeptidase/acylaminoacyl peptidase
MAISEPVGGSFPSYAPVRRFANVLSPASGNCDFAYITDETGSFNLWRVDASSGEARQVTRFVDRSVNSAAYSPDGTLIAISCDHGGQESPEIVLLNREGETVHALASIPRVSRRLNIAAWSPDGRFLAYGSNERGDHSDTDILALDVRSGESQPLIEAAGWHVFGSWSPDGGRILAAKVESITNQKLCIARLGLPSLQVLRTFEGEASCEAGGWSADGAGVYYLSNAGREFRGLALHDLASDVSRWVETPEWDIELFSMSRDGAVCAWTVNRDGVSELSMRRQSDGRRIALPSVPEGVILEMAFTRDAEWLGLLISTGTTPKDLYTIHLRSGCLVRLTRSVANIPSGTEPTRLRYRTHDGRLVPSLLYRPPTKPGVRLPYSFPSMVDLQRKNGQPMSTPVCTSIFSVGALRSLRRMSGAPQDTARNTSTSFTGIGAAGNSPTWSGDGATWIRRNGWIAPGSPSLVAVSEAFWCCR